VIRPPRGWPNRVFDLFSAPHVVSGRGHGTDRDRRSISPATGSRRTSSEIENHYRKGLRHSTRPLRAFSRLHQLGLHRDGCDPKTSLMAGLAAIEEVRSHPTRHGKHSDHRDRLLPAHCCAVARTPRVKSPVRIGVSKTGFTGFSTRSCTRTRREIATIIPPTTSPSRAIWRST
jgi:hypothetical protein